MNFPKDHRLPRHDQWNLGSLVGLIVGFFIVGGALFYLLAEKHPRSASSEASAVTTQGQRAPGTAR